ncbi:MAG: hypothetical protein IPL78_28965 [Chloroflexi bacterium]|nr:hypothetical protein [Chloroflexota bacterium]
MNLESSDFALNLHSASVRDRGKIRLTVNNLSDTPQTYQVHARHWGDLLQFAPDEQHIQVAPHSNWEVAIEVWVGNSHWWQPGRWAKTDYDFDIIVANPNIKKQVRAPRRADALFWLTLITTFFILLGGLILGSFYTLEKQMVGNREIVAEYLTVQADQLTTEAYTGGVIETAIASENFPLSPTKAPLSTAVLETPVPINVTIVLTTPIEVPVLFTPTSQVRAIQIPIGSYSPNEDEAFVAKPCY